MCEPIDHKILRDVYHREMREAEEASLPRQDRVNLTRFRTGYHPSLGRWRSMLGRNEDPTCRLCQMGEESAEHLWLECRALEDLRRMWGFGRLERSEGGSPLCAVHAAEEGRRRDVVCVCTDLQDDQQEGEVRGLRCGGPCFSNGLTREGLRRGDPYRYRPAVWRRAGNTTQRSRGGGACGLPTVQGDAEEGEPAVFSAWVAAEEPTKSVPSGGVGEWRCHECPLHNPEDENGPPNTNLPH